MAHPRRPAITGLALAAALIVLPACEGSGGRHFLRGRDNAAPYVANRTPYGVAPAPARSLFLSGYAGYQYPPLVPSVDPLAPTAYGASGSGTRAHRGVFGWLRGH